MFGPTKPAVRRIFAFASSLFDGGRHSYRKPLRVVRCERHLKCLLDRIGQVNCNRLLRRGGGTAPEDGWGNSHAIAGRPAKDNQPKLSVA